MMKYLQKLGKSLMLPVAVLPVCAIFMGIGYLLCPHAMQGGEISGFVPVLGYILVKAGGAIIDHIAILFAIGVAIGMSDDGHGSACLAALVAWLIVTSLLTPKLCTVINPAITEDSATYLAFSKIENPFFGIACGLIGAGMYNRFKNTKLPEILAFFSGRRAVLILTAFVSFIFAVIMFFVWPLLFDGLVMVGRAILNMGGIGVGLYTFLNRLLLPFGLHHTLNNIFWFDTIGIGDLTAYWAGKTAANVGWSVGMYMSGFFPCFIFGIPGAILAIVQASKNKKKTMGSMLSVGFSSVLCGVTEPFEFSFMFSAFPLYVIYALLNGIVATVTYYTGFRAGFAFSAGLIDLGFSGSLPAAANTWMILPLGIGTFLLFWITFRLYIHFFGLVDPSEDESDALSTEVSDSVNTNGGDKDQQQAALIYDALGGRDNISEVDCCATRLRLILKSTEKIDQKKIIASGAYGIQIIDKNNCQIVIGMQVQHVSDELKMLVKNGNTDTLNLPDPLPDSQKILDANDIAPQNLQDKILSHEEVNTVKSEEEPQDNLSLDGELTTPLWLETCTLPAKGELVPMNAIPDPTFAQGILGECVGVEPAAGDIYAPCDGTIVTIAPTKHAIGICAENGEEWLIHVGIDTVKLEGRGFDCLITEGAEVKKGELLMHFDVNAVRRANFSAMVILVKIGN